MEAHRRAVRIGLPSARRWAPLGCRTSRLSGLEPGPMNVRRLMLSWRSAQVNARRAFFEQLDHGPSDPALYLAHILESIELVQSWVADIDLVAFSDSQQIQDAVVRRLEIIGEAVKNLPADLRDAAPGVPWRQIAGMRDKVAHDAMGVDMERVWTVVHQDLPGLAAEVQNLLERVRSAEPSRVPRAVLAEAALETRQPIQRVTAARAPGTPGTSRPGELPAPDQTTAAGWISSISAASSEWMASQRSTACWRLSQNSGSVLLNFARRRALSGVTARFPLTISFIRGYDMRRRSAASRCVMPRGSRKSSKKTSPGGVGRRFFGKRRMLRSSGSTPWGGVNGNRRFRRPRPRRRSTGSRPGTDR